METKARIVTIHGNWTHAFRGNTALMSSKSANTPKKKPGRDTDSVSGKPTSKRLTVAVLAQKLKSLETRLKGADTNNKSALKALEVAIEEIKTTSNFRTDAQKSALSDGLTKFEIRMETYLARAATDARAGVRSDLARVTALGADLTTLNKAVQAAHVRLDDLDRLQRDALARLNRHLADLATSVEKRLDSESKARKAVSAALDAKIDSVRKSFETRVEQVEQDTAGALKVVGDKITEFATILEERAKTSDVETAERLADLAQEAKQNDFLPDVTARLDALEMIASSWTPERPANPYLPANSDDPRIDQMGEMIEALQDELSQMHARMAGIRPPDSSAPSASPTNVVPMSDDTQAAPENPYASAIRALEISTVESPPADITPAPAAPVPSSHVPQEFDPTAFSTEPDAAPIFDPPVIPAPPVPPALAPPHSVPNVAPHSPPMANPEGFAPVQTEGLSGFHGNDPIMPAPLPVSTYDDPAYAEADDMRAERIGGETTKRKSFAKPVISGRNLRVGALAVGVSVLGLFAAKTILGGPDGELTQVRRDAPAVSTPQGDKQNQVQANVSAGPSNAASPPLGQYSDMQAPTLASAGQDTLDAAVEAGNPIAQFQKGLVQLQVGQTEDGARLIRLSANRNQPAAQYRLAKLYESGTGLAKDPITARELIERAAIGGNRIAMHDLGNYYAYGQGGLDQDMGAALEWFTKAAERGVVDSQFNVAFLREGNEGVPADLETALFWYQIAARQGDQGAPDRIQVLSTQVDATTMSDIKARADKFNPKPVDEAANGVFRDVPWAKKNGAKTSVSSAQITQIRDAQTLLSSLGYNVGAPDGVAGSKTRTAVKSFQAVNGMPETGRVTDELIRKLEIANRA